MEFAGAVKNTSLEDFLAAFQFNSSPLDKGCGKPRNFSRFVCSLAGQPTYFRSTDRFQYRHAEEWSGDLGPLHVKPLERNN